MLNERSLFTEEQESELNEIKTQYQAGCPKCSLTRAHPRQGKERYREEERGRENVLHRHIMPGAGRNFTSIIFINVHTSP